MRRRGITKVSDEGGHHALFVSTSKFRGALSDPSPVPLQCLAISRP